MRATHGGLKEWQRSREGDRESSSVWSFRFCSSLTGFLLIPHRFPDETKYATMGVWRDLVGSIRNLL